VPEGFTEGLLSGKDVKLEKTTLPNSTSNVYMDNIINKYLNTVKIYTYNIKDLSEEQLISHVDKDMSQKIEVTLSRGQTLKSEKPGYYFNYLAYSLFAILILGVCSVMMVLMIQI